MLEAEHLLTSSALLHPQGKENCVNAYHLGQRILELRQQKEKADAPPLPPLLSDDSDSSAYTHTRLKSRLFHFHRFTAHYSPGSTESKTNEYKGKALVTATDYTGKCSGVRGVATWHN